jgi:hypothetical protein
MVPKYSPDSPLKNSSSQTPTKSFLLLTHTTKEGTCQQAGPLFRGLVGLLALPDGLEVAELPNTGGSELAAKA